MKLNQAFNSIINTYTDLLQLCHDALAKDFDQGKRDQLREVLAKHVADNKSNKDGASRD